MRKKLPSLSGIITALIGLAFMFLGVYRGEASVVFAKAIRVCLECIGIG